MRRWRGSRGGERIVVAIDQLEELFTAASSEPERAAFLEQLVAAARDPDRRALVVASLRADFYGRLASYPGFAQLLSSSHVLVGPMDRDELARAIERARDSRRARGRANVGRGAGGRRGRGAGRAAAALDDAAGAVAGARRAHAALRELPRQRCITRPTTRSPVRRRRIIATRWLTVSHRSTQRYSPTTCRPASSISSHSLVTRVATSPGTTARASPPWPWSRRPSLACCRRHATIRRRCRAR